MDGLSLPSRLLSDMQAHVEAHAPLEACGLLAGRGRRVQAVLPVPNRAGSTTRFVMEPVEQLRAFAWIDAHDMELLAIFHSHPAGPETLSETDIAEAAYEVAQILWTRAGGSWSMRAYRIAGGDVREVSLQIVESGPGG